MLFHKPTHSQPASCQVVPPIKPVSPEQLAQAATVIILVRGMGGPACALCVRNGLLQIEGVVAATVLLTHGLAKVWYDPKVLQPETLPARLPAVADDASYHYTAHLLVDYEQVSAGSSATP
jgi:hypothetical protein